jgi:cobalamin biosynthesis protein CbiD
MTRQFALHRWSLTNPRPGNTTAAAAAAAAAAARRASRRSHVDGVHCTRIAGGALAEREKYDSFIDREVGEASIRLTRQIVAKIFP